MKKCAGIIIIGIAGWLGNTAAAPIPPNGAGYWWLGPELMANGTFESDTAGNVPSGWSQGPFNGSSLTTASTGHGSSKSMEYTSAYGGGQLATGIASSPDKYYRLAFWWQKVSVTSGGPTMFASPVSDNSPTQSFNTDGFSNVGVQSETTSIWTSISMNSRWPGYEPYNVTIGDWNFFAATFKTLPDLTTDWGNLVRVNFGVTQGTGTLRVDDISLREWVPEPTTGLLFALFAAGLAQIRRRAPRA